MGLAPVTAVSTPELIGVLAWWAVMLAVPMMLVRLWRRRVRRERRSAIPGAYVPDGNVVPGLGSGVPQPAAVAPGGSLVDRRRSTPSAGGRLAPETLEPLCRHVDFRRRLELAAAELERRLSVLPGDQWRIEPYPLTGERRNTLMVLGATGVFVISATYPPGSWDDVVAVNRLAGKVQTLLPGYVGQVQPAICHPFASLQPRIWYRADDHSNWVGAWLIGGNSLIQWLERFGSAQGLGAGDLERFDELAKPNWLRPAIPTAPTWPPVPDQAPSEPQG
jgi:hypothetical protein